MIEVLKPPKRLTKKYDYKLKIFLAGSIENGKAKDWQSHVINLLNKEIPEQYHDEILILNPRRDDWDSSLENSAADINFSTQVLWEYNGLERADHIIMYFEPATVSRISLMELGKFHDNMIVVCPEGYSHKGNVDIFCEEYAVDTADTLEGAVKKLIELECWE